MSEEKETTSLPDNSGNGDLTETKTENSGDADGIVKSSDNTKENLANIEPDPFAYVKNNGFTSEIFKIEVRGLPKFYGIGVSLFFNLVKRLGRLKCG